MTKSVKCSLHRCYVSDNFIRTNGPTSINPNGVDEVWTAPWGGSWVSANQDIGQLGYVHQALTASIYAILTTGSYGYFAVSCDFSTYPTKSGESWVAGLYIPYLNDNNYVWTYITPYGLLYLRKKIGGIESGIVTVPITGILAEDRHNLKYIIDYGTYSLYVDDDLKLTGYDSNLLTLSGKVGMYTKYSDGWFSNFQLYEKKVFEEGRLWFDFYMTDYNIKPSVRINKVPIPGHYGDRLQNAGEGNKVYNITGKVFSKDFDIDTGLGPGEYHGTSVDYAMETVYRNNIPVCVFTPEFTTSGIVTDYSFPKPIKGKTSKVADITIELTEKYFYE
jgi:hypothetical protein